MVPLRRRKLLHNHKPPSNAKNGKSSKEETWDPKFHIGTRFREAFLGENGGGERLFSGHVAAYDGPASLYHVRYEDGEEEEMDEDKLEEIVV
ncbi:hypothetical protein THAOC_34756, partial [Thalassiosira oceanica]